MTVIRSERVRAVLLTVTAVLMLGLVLLPAGVWHAPRVDTRATGFDQSTMYADPGGPNGAATITPRALTLVTTAGSSPVAHLTTGPLSQDVRFSVAIKAAQAGSSPFLVEITAPYTDYRFRLAFVTTPAHQVLFQRLHRGRLIDQRVVGDYENDQRYDVRVVLDRRDRSASITVTTPDDEQQPGNVLDLVSTRRPYQSHVITAGVVPVSAGQIYELSARLKPLLDGVEGIGIEWLDGAGRRLAQSTRWAHSFGAPQGADDREPVWGERTLRARAPAGATHARVELATARGARALFADAALVRVDTGANLLVNGTFRDNAAGWRRAEGRAPLLLRSFVDRSLTVRTDERQWPELFDTLRMSVSVGADSTAGFGVATLTEYRAEMLHQRWLAVRVADWRPRLAAVLLAGAGIALGWGSIRRAVQRVRRWSSSELADRVLVVAPRAILLGLLLGVLFFVGNALLARIGSVNADVVGYRVWVYEAGYHGPAGVYSGPNFASAEATQWNGLPLQEAGFPYGPVMAYVFGALGAAYRVFIHQPVTGPSDLTQVDVLVKGTVALFALADAAVAYLILRARGVGVRASRLVLLALVFNPAIWFAGDVWGTTQTISLLFLLLAIYFTDRTWLVPAWTFLIAAVLTRPQNIFVAFVLAVILLRTSPVRRSVSAISAAVVITFVYLLPFALVLSPTLPADVLGNVLFLHVGNGNDEWTMPVSFGGMSIWPVVTQFAAGVHGDERILYSATHPLLGTLTYYQVGAVLAAIFLIAIAVVCATRGQRLNEAGRVPTVLAATSLGTFLLNTETPSYHLVLAVVLVALTRSSLPRRAYWICFGALTTVTFVAMYAMGSYWLSRHPRWDVGIFDPSSPLTRFMAGLPHNDAVVTTLCLVNVAVLGYLIWRAFGPIRPSMPPDAGEPAAVSTSPSTVPVGAHR